jgi:hypothetical protein
VSVCTEESSIACISAADNLLVSGTQSLTQPIEITDSINGYLFFLLLIYLIFPSGILMEDHPVLYYHDCNAGVGNNLFIVIPIK